MREGVQRVAIVEVGTVDQQRAGAVWKRCLEEAHVARVAADADRERLDERARRDPSVCRERDGRVPAETGERGRQRARARRRALRLS